MNECGQTAVTKRMVNKITGIHCLLMIVVSITFSVTAIAELSGDWRAFAGLPYSIDNGVVIATNGSFLGTGLKYAVFLEPMQCAFSWVYQGATNTMPDFKVWNSPPSVNAGGPYYYTTGQTLTVVAHGSDPNPQERLLYAWQFEPPNGSFTALSPNPTATYVFASAKTHYIVCVVSDTWIGVHGTYNGALGNVGIAQISALETAPVVSVRHRIMGGTYSSWTNNETIVQPAMRCNLEVESNSTPPLIVEQIAHPANPKALGTFRYSYVACRNGLVSKPAEMTIDVPGIAMALVVGWMPGLIPVYTWGLYPFGAGNTNIFGMYDEAPRADHDGMIFLDRPTNSMVSVSLQRDEPKGTVSFTTNFFSLPQNLFKFPSSSYRYGGRLIDFDDYYSSGIFTHIPSVQYTLVLFQGVGFAGTGNNSNGYYNVQNIPSPWPNDNDVTGSAYMVFHKQDWSSLCLKKTPAQIQYEKLDDIWGLWHTNGTISISGTVRSQLTHLPVPLARVSFGQIRADAGPDGQFVLSNLPPPTVFNPGAPTHVLVTEADGCEPLRHVFTNTTQAINTVELYVRPSVWRLGELRTPSLHGMVYDPDSGLPLTTGRIFTVANNGTITNSSWINSCGYYQVAMPEECEYASIEYNGNTRPVALTRSYAGRQDVRRDLVLAIPDAVLYLTSTAASVAYPVTSFAVSGTNNAYVVGTMWVTNATAGGAGQTFAATPSWTAPAVSLATGVNCIVVFGTNASGRLASDSVAITREQPSPIPVVSPLLLDFSSNAMARICYLSNGGASNFAFAATASSAAGWLSLQEPAGGTVSNQQVMLMAIATRVGMTNGVYEGYVTILPSVGDTVVVTCRMTVVTALQAKPGGPYNVAQGSAAVLNGSQSTGYGLEYAWQIGTMPQTAFSNLYAVYAYTDYEPGVRTVTLSVREAGTPLVVHSAQTLLTIMNVAPTIDAGGPYQSIVGLPLTFRAQVGDAGTVDVLSVRWNFEGVWTAWQGESATNVSHIFGTNGVHTVECQVCDNHGGTNSDSATAIIGLPNQPPFAVATLGWQGHVYTDMPGMKVSMTLDGSGASDPDNKPLGYLLYEWREDVANPAKPLLADNVKTQMIVQFGGPFPRPGTYKYHLVVNDGEYNSAPSTVQVNVPGVEGKVRCDGMGNMALLYGVTVSVVNVAYGQTDWDITDFEGNFVVDSGVGNNRQLTLSRNARTNVTRNVHVGNDGESGVELSFTPNFGSLSATVMQNTNGAPVVLPFAKAEVVIGNEVKYTADGNMNGELVMGGVPETWPQDATVNYQVLYQRVGYESKILPAQIDAGHNTEHTPVLPPAIACTLHGQVIGMNGLPVEGVDLYLGPWYPSVTARSAADGAFTVDGVMPGDYYVRLTASGFDTTYRTVTVLPGVTNQTLSSPLLIRGGTYSVYGEASDAEDGTPVGNLVVRALGGTTTATARAKVATAQVVGTQLGYFDLAVVRGTRTVVVEAEGYLPVTNTIAVDGHKPQNIQLTPVPEPAVAGAMAVIGYGLFVIRARRK